ncbi:MAG: hypothetical protein M3177_01005 [Pseudomonadota bacterium]|nr:hypothetical protein [Pseudomonadota bacterium]
MWTTATHNDSKPSGPLLLDYDSNEDGPLFAVSDEGSAGPAVVEAAYSSAKAAAVSSAGVHPLRLGVILDGERMTSAGETPIGPPEYRWLSATAAGRLLLTTNVGTRANVRLAGQLPEFAGVVGSAEAVVAYFQPFLRTPDGQPRPSTVRLRVEPGANPDELASLVARLEQERSEGRIGPADIHRLSILVAFEDAIAEESQLAFIEAAIAAAGDLRIPEVAVDGALLPFARQRISAQGLLGVLRPQDLNRLLAIAAPRGVRLVGRLQIDVEATARTIWTGLEAARTQGFDGGKYGLLPLTLEEQAQTIELLTRWTAGWTAIPAFYVDTPLVTATEVFEIERCEAAARRWLKAARGAGAAVALFDAPDRVAPRKLVKSADSPDGVLTPDQIESLARYGELLGIRIMWSGGITARQALDLARRRVFAIFSTSSTAARTAVTASFASDPRLAAENEPQEFGVRRMHALVQSGFLSSRLAQSDPDLVRELEAATERLLADGLEPSDSQAALAHLDERLLQAWRHVHAGAASGTPATAPAQARVKEAPQPVPADAVRVFRGRKHAGAPHQGFVKRLETVFMPMTVQMQRLYGLTAYLPAVLPASDGTLPDEVALVFYRTQASYHEAKRCIGGRAYSELHDLAFDMPASRSGFPILLEGDRIRSDQPYHLFEAAVDWQGGESRILVGRRKAAQAPAEFLDAVGSAARRVQQEAQSIDAAIFVATDEMILWWDHAPTGLGAVDYFEDVADTVYAAAPRRLRIPTDLTEPFVGISVKDEGDFLNFQFSRF